MSDVQLYLGDCLEVMAGMEANGVHLIVTSPPYNLDVDYGHFVTDKRADYMDWLCEVLAQFERILITGGRLCLNLPAHTSQTLGGFEVLDVPRRATGIGFNLRATHIWYKPNHVGGTAWGSWLSPSCPTALPNHEYVFVFDTGYTRYDRKGSGDATKEEFVQFIKTVWPMSPAIKINQKGQNVLGHNAPFPKELPYRCLKLHSWPGDIVVDSFMGSGTTGVVAVETRRNFVGIEIEPTSFELAKSRIEGTQIQLL